MATITNAQVRIADFGSLRPGDPVPITVHLPDGDQTVQAWVRETHYEEGWDEPYSASIQFYTPREVQKRKNYEEILGGEVGDF